MQNETTSLFDLDYEEVETHFLTDGVPGLNNVMLDLETWGTAPGSAIRSIGAVTFDPFSERIGTDKFYANISTESCTRAGLAIDPGTKEWWSNQSQQARDALMVDPKDLADVSDLFNRWWRVQGGIFVWSHGANFDGPLWEAAVAAVGRSVPWKFYDSRCTRTVFDVARFNMKKEKRTGTHHNALDDAEFQAACVQKSYAKITLKRG